MIQLFSVPDYKIDTSKFTNLLHDPVKTFVEARVAQYVGAKYAVALASCTDGIFLALKQRGYFATCTVPSLSTTRFMNAIVHSGNYIQFTDDVDWVGSHYWLTDDIIDSAQQFDPNQYADLKKDDDTIMIFSHYPTKPMGGLKGGTVVSNNKDKIDWIRQAAYFGEQFTVNSWDSKPGFIGWQMYMNSVEAYMVNESLNRYEDKRRRLDTIRTAYSTLNGVTKNSYHLYRIRVDDSKAFMAYMKENDIHTGIHYTAAHLDPVYGSGECPRSEIDAETVVSIPFHAALRSWEIEHVVKTVKAYEAI